MPFVRNGVDTTSEIQNGRWQQAPSHTSVPFCQSPNPRSSRSASVRPTQGLAYCAAYKVGPCIRSPPPLQEALYKVRGAQGQGRIPRPVFPAVQAIRTSHLRRHTGCPWHFAKSRISNVGVNVNINVNNNIAVNLNENTPFKPSPPSEQRKRWLSVAFCQNENTKP